MALEYHGQAVGAVELRERGLHGADEWLVGVDGVSSLVAGWFFGEFPLQAISDQVGDDFRVGGRAEAVAFALEPFLKWPEVLDHSVMHHGQHMVAAEVRMRVDVGRRTV